MSCIPTRFLPGTQHLTIPRCCLKHPVTGPPARYPIALCHLPQLLAQAPPRTIRQLAFLLGRSLTHRLFHLKKEDARFSRRALGSEPGAGKMSWAGLTDVRCIGARIAFLAAAMTGVTEVNR